MATVFDFHSIYYHNFKIFCSLLGDSETYSLSITNTFANLTAVEFLAGKSNSAFNTFTPSIYKTIGINENDSSPSFCDIADTFFDGTSCTQCPVGFSNGTSLTDPCNYCVNNKCLECPAGSDLMIDKLTKGCDFKVDTCPKSGYRFSFADETPKFFCTHCFGRPGKKNINNY